MSLGDIVSRLGLWFFPTLALVIFLAAFAAIAWRAMAPRRREAFREAASLPLNDDTGPIKSPTRPQGAPR